MKIFIFGYITVFILVLSGADSVAGTSDSLRKKPNSFTLEMGVSNSELIEPEASRLVTRMFNAAYGRVFLFGRNQIHARIGIAANSQRTVVSINKSNEPRLEFEIQQKFVQYVFSPKFELAYSRSILTRPLWSMNLGVCANVGYFLNFVDEVGLRSHFDSAGQTSIVKLASMRSNSPNQLSGSRLIGGVSPELEFLHKFNKINLGIQIRSTFYTESLGITRMQLQRSLDNYVTAEKIWRIPTFSLGLRLYW